MLFKFFALRQNNDIFCLMRHIPHRLRPELILVRKTCLNRVTVYYKNTLLTNQYPELNKTIHSLFYENLLVFPQILRMQGLHIFKGVIPG